MSPQDIKKALRHLKKDKLLGKAMVNLPKPDQKIGEDYFGEMNKDYFPALLRSIIYQQISGKAAKAVEGRFRAVFKDNKPTPKQVLKLDDRDFKSAGISPQKMKYIRDLSEKFINGAINPSYFQKMSDDDIRNHLISVKGVGHWTIDMFLIFTLKRSDVLPTGDLGIAKGFQKIFNLKKLPDARKMERLANSWRPYRSVASWYLWKVADKEKEV